MEIPDTYYCALTRALLVDPVDASDGYTYEREAIQTYLASKKCSPITGKPISTTLTPNRALRTAIDAIRSTVPLEHAKRVVQPRVDPRKKKLSMDVVTDGKHALLSVIPPTGAERVPCDVCCVVDTSGSMGSEATLKSLTGDVESHGLSILDVVKHAVKTIVQTLSQNDRLAIVSFNNKATVVLPLTVMNDVGKLRASNKVEQLRQHGSTHLWGGLLTGLNLLKEESTPNATGTDYKNRSLFLLTDGVPNRVPPEGHLPILKKYMKDNEKVIKCTINTFGFGYNLDSVLLDEIAMEGGGNFSFIPDSSFVGTIFVNALTNLVTTVASETVVEIVPLEGTTIAADDLLVNMAKADDDVGKSKSKVKGKNDKSTVTTTTTTTCDETNTNNSDNKRNNDIYRYNIGSVRYGQTRDVVFPVSISEGDAPYLQITLRYVNHLFQTSVSYTTLATRRDNSKSIELHRHRLRVVKALRNIPTIHLDSACKQIESLAADIEQSPLLDSEAFLSDLVKDLRGQTLEALSPDAWNRWGRHYLPSLAEAHLQQRCNNFKDFGVQHYGGEFFNKVRDEVDDIFLKLPAPTPAPHYVTVTGTAAPVNMSAYYNSGGGCIDGDCTVVTVDGVKRIKDITQGDVVQCVDNAWATVQCVVKTVFVDNRVDVVTIGGLTLTPFHPISINGKWVFPIDLSPVITVSKDAVYDFVLESGGNHVMLVNGVGCVTLGHRLVGDVVGHPYFGSERVVEDLKRMSGWKDGLVVLKGGVSFERCRTTGLVCALKEQQPFVVS